MPDLTPEKIFVGVTSYIVFLLCVSVHESAHGWTALKMGDDTAAREGRITLNPIAHIDPIGTVLIPMLMFFYGVRLIGWAKPTPVGAHNFRKLARGHILVAGAGPFSNLLLAIIFVLLLLVFVRTGIVVSNDSLIKHVLEIGVGINVSLMIFNLLPIPPLDGSWIVSWGLPRHLAVHYDRVMEPYGYLIFIALYVTTVIDWILWPPVRFVEDLLFRLVY